MIRVTRRILKRSEFSWAIAKRHNQKALLGPSILVGGREREREGEQERESEREREREGESATERERGRERERVGERETWWKGQDVFVSQLCQRSLGCWPSLGPG